MKLSIINIKYLILLFMSNVIFSMELKFDYGDGKLSVFSQNKDLGTTLTNKLDDPVTFGLTSKQNNKAVKELIRHNLIEMYSTQDPSYLLNHYVPILFIDLRFLAMQKNDSQKNPEYIYDLNRLTGNDKNATFIRGHEVLFYEDVINPYSSDFYSQPTVINEKITIIEKKIKNQCIHPQNVITSARFEDKCINNKEGQLGGDLTRQILFCKNQEEVKIALNNYRSFYKSSFRGLSKNKDDLLKKKDLGFDTLYAKLRKQYLTTLLAVMKYSFYDNNAFRQLLLTEKKIRLLRLWSVENQSFGNEKMMLYLLCYAQKVKNHEAFKDLIEINPYFCSYNEEIYENYYIFSTAVGGPIYNGPQLSNTLLDLLTDYNFDEQNISILKAYGGTSTDSCIIS